MNRNNVLAYLCVITVTIILEPTASQMECKYGERGSLTVYCTNASALYIKASRYRYDHLDETLKCINCKLVAIEEGTFDIAGNQLKTVDIRNSSIQLIHRKAFIGLVFMTTLYLSNNPIKEIYPGAFSGIRKVKYLELENAVTQLHPEVFQELILLQTLILRNNNLSSIEPGTFRGLHNLKTLDLSNNKLIVVDEIFEPLLNLEMLDLQNNCIIKIHGDEFKSLKNLVSLDLNRNHLQTISGFVQVKNNIRKLNLAENDLSEHNTFLDTFKYMYNLETLDLSMNQYAVFPPQFFQGLYGLRVLNLYGNSITEFSTGTFSGLPNLKSLNLSQNQLESARATGQLALTNLHELDLSNNHINSFDYVSLMQRCPKLSFINLSNNTLTCELFVTITTFLEKDSIHVLVDKDKDCSKTPSMTQKQMKAELEKYTGGSKVNYLMITLFTLIVFIIISIAGLYYVQFFVLSKLR